MFVVIQFTFVSKALALVAKGEGENSYIPNKTLIVHSSSSYNFVVQFGFERLMTTFLLEHLI